MLLYISRKMAFVLRERANPSLKELWYSYLHLPKSLSDKKKDYCSCCVIIGGKWAIISELYDLIGAFTRQVKSMMPVIKFQSIGINTTTIQMDQSDSSESGQ